MQVTHASEIKPKGLEIVLGGSNIVKIALGGSNIVKRLSNKCSPIFLLHPLFYLVPVWQVWHLVSVNFIMFLQPPLVFLWEPTFSLMLSFGQIAQFICTWNSLAFLSFFPMSSKLIYQLHMELFSLLDFFLTSWMLMELLPARRLDCNWHRTRLHHQLISAPLTH